MLIPLLLILPLFFGLDGILYAWPCADITSALIVLGFIWPELCKLNALIRQEDVSPTNEAEPDLVLRHQGA